VIILLFLCYSVLQSCVIKLYTSSISHCQAFVKWPGSSPDGSRDSTQKVGDKSGAVLCCGCRCGGGLARFRGRSHIPVIPPAAKWVN
jgi:hypothetical protein